MRAALLTCVLLASVLQLSAQQNSTTRATVSGVLDRMNSAGRAEREKAFGEAGELLEANTTSAKDADRLQLGIIQLLIRENKKALKARELPSSNSASEEEQGQGEDESDYYSVLVGFVANLNDVRAVPTLLGAANTGGIATRGIARFGKRALDPTLVQVESANADLAEGALWVIRDMLEFRLVGDPESHLRIKDALRAALRSSEFGVRVSAMGAIEYLDDREEFVPLLKEVAQNDPVKLAGQRPDDGGDNGEFYPARFDARRLLRKIANHEQPRIDRGLPPSEYQPVKP
jgi:hypothetical protein